MTFLYLSGNTTSTTNATFYMLGLGDPLISDTHVVSLQKGIECKSDRELIWSDLMEQQETLLPVRNVRIEVVEGLGRTLVAGDIIEAVDSNKEGRSVVFSRLLLMRYHWSINSGGVRGRRADHQGVAIDSGSFELWGCPGWW